MKKYTRILLALSCLVFIVACSKKGATPNESGPVISNLIYDPKTVTLKPNSTFTFVGTVNYENASGGVSQFRLTTSVGGDVTVPVPQNSQSSGTLSGYMEVAMPSAVGSYSFELWIIDASGNSSNKLSGTVQAVIDDGATNWRVVSQTWGLHRVLWANNQYIAVGEHEVILTSQDGVNWHQQNSPLQNVGTDITLYGVTWSGSLYVVVGRFKTILTSSDAIYWTVRSLEIPGVDLSGVASSGNDFVAVGGNPPGGIQIFHSTDGINWTQTYAQAGNKSLNSVRWVGNQYIAVGGYPLILTSPDGLNWSEKNVSGDIGGGELADISFSGAKYASVGWAITASSSDGINWNGQMRNWGSSGIVWSGNKFVAGTITSIMSSTDGVNWTEACQSPYPLRSITWSGMQYIAVGHISPVIMASP